MLVESFIPPKRSFFLVFSYFYWHQAFKNSFLIHNQVLFLHSNNTTIFLKPHNPFVHPTVHVCLFQPFLLFFPFATDHFVQDYIPFPRLVKNRISCYACWVKALQLLDYNESILRAGEKKLCRPLLEMSMYQLFLFSLSEFASLSIDKRNNKRHPREWEQWK